MFMHKISYDQTEPIRQAMENVETQMKMMLKIDFSACVSVGMMVMVCLAPGRAELSRLYSMCV